MAPLPEGETPQPRLVPPPKDEPPPPAESSTLDVVSPAGARVRIDGTPLKKRVPVRGLTLEPGRHRVQVSKGKYRRTVDVTLAPGDHEVVRFRRKKRRKRRR